MRRCGEGSLSLGLWIDDESEAVTDGIRHVAMKAVITPLRTRDEGLQCSHDILGGRRRFGHEIDVGAVAAGAKLM